MGQKTFKVWRIKAGQVSNSETPAVCHCRGDVKGVFEVWTPGGSNKRVNDEWATATLLTSGVHAIAPYDILVGARKQRWKVMAVELELVMDEPAVAKMVDPVKITLRRLQRYEPAYRCVP